MKASHGAATGAAFHGAGAHVILRPSGAQRGLAPQICGLSAALRRRQGPRRLAQLRFRHIHARPGSGAVTGFMHTTNELRQMFLSFMESKGHKILPGISLVPTDPSIFLTTAGVVPFQAMLEGREPAPYPRVATCQRCCRTTDIDNVGRLARHHTFFEMLGNWSFGDYFKRESLTWGWEFITGQLGLKPDRLWATIFPDDEEAWQIWRGEIGLPEGRIIRLEDNWWGPVLETGACGPDSEIYYDLGPEFGCGSPACRPGCDCDRYLEFWNHVFTQYYRHADGAMTPLEKKNIDTGMGLERLTCVVQNAPSVYETDLFAPIMQSVDEILGRSSPGAVEEAGWRRRVLADHGRAAAFMVMDGIYPANAGRGYVLRRLIRRAVTQGYQLGMREPFIYRLIPVIVEKMSPGYPELIEKQALITDQIRREEEQFSRTLERGVPRFLEAAAAGGTVDGAFAWDVYATSGVPLEVMRELAAEAGAALDEEGFAAARRQHSLISGRGLAVKSNVRAFELPPTLFEGYQSASCEAEIRALLHGEDEVESLSAGEEGMLLLDRTPFYGEAGGQVGDTGRILAGEGGSLGAAAVLDTVRQGPHFLHLVRVEQGRLHPGQQVEALVDTERRQAIRRAHTATHLLHAALRRHLGPHVVQRGSVVEPDRLRFDFAHGAALDTDDLQRVEDWMMEAILKNAPIRISERTQQEAQQLGAMMLFGEKYGERVRVVEAPGLSIELCGGLHAAATGEIGLVKVVSEGSAAAGVRRVECSTGLAALRHIHGREDLLKQVAEALGGVPDQILSRIQNLQSQVSQLRRQLDEARRAAADGAVDELLASRTELHGMALLAASVDLSDAEAARAMVDQLADRMRGGVVVLGARAGGKGLLVARAAPDAVRLGVHAGNLLREVARLAGGGGGGRPEFAQAGAGSGERLPEAIAAVPELLEKQIRNAG